MRRRIFLEKCGLAGSAILSPALLSARWSSLNFLSGQEHDVDIVIIGGGLGGCAAAMAACATGARVVMTEPTDWIGGQVSQQGVPPDEHAIAVSGRVRHRCWSVRAVGRRSGRQ